MHHPGVGKLVAWAQVKAQTDFAYDYTFLDGDDDSAGCFDKKSSGWSACAYSCDRTILSHQVFCFCVLDDFTHLQAYTFGVLVAQVVHG